MFVSASTRLMLLLDKVAHLCRMLALSLDFVLLLDVFTQMFCELALMIGLAPVCIKLAQLFD